MKTVIFSLFTLISLSAFASTPDNNFYIGADEKAASLLKEKDYNRIIDRVQEIYGDSVTINRDWKDGTVNAYAQIYDGDRYIFTFGGFARFPNMTEDSYALVLCHEAGHHFGGNPRMRRANRWASAEGQADYYATNTCMKQYYSDWTDEQLLDGVSMPDEVAENCSKVYSDSHGVNICVRAVWAGENLANIFEQFDVYSMYVPSVLTPSERVVTKTLYDKYPSTQCRLDTYYAGAANWDRPACWYKADN